MTRTGAGWEGVPHELRGVGGSPAATTWDRFPSQWRGMLDEVWACLRQARVKGGCNVMLYRDLPTAGHVAVEVGSR
jgi:hypothetical protein